MKNSHTLIAAICLLSFSLQAQTEAPATPAGPPVHPSAEWYLVGWEMAREALTAYRPFKTDAQVIEEDLDPILQMLAVELNSIKTSDYEMLQKGWQDGVNDTPAAYSLPADQRSSKVPLALRGFHTFQGGDSDNSFHPDNIEKIQHGVVQVRIPGAHGSGVFIGPEHVLTNRHVVEGNKTVIIFNDFSKKAVIAEVVGIKTVNEADLAILHVPEAHLLNPTVIPIADPSTTKVGDEIMLLGYPEFNFFTVTTTFGRISAKRQDPSNGQVIQLSGAEVNGGNSGGPILNKQGKIVGLTTYAQPGLDGSKLEGFNFGVNISEAMGLISKHCPEAIAHIK